jgi:hypothetical protein
MATYMVASESAFSGADRVIDSYCNCLDTEMVQALICTKDWIKAARKGTKIFYLIRMFQIYVMY